MSTESKPNDTEIKIWNDVRGKYSFVNDKKIYHFEFPATNTLMQNYEMISFLKKETWAAIEKSKKDEDDKEVMPVNKEVPTETK